MRKTVLIILAFVVLSCKQKEVPTQFSAEALNDTFITLQDETVTFNDIIQAHKGQTLLIDVWASWCKDCIEGMPKVKTLQKEYPNVTFLFLSLDKTKEAWRKGIEKHPVTGDHYFMQSGWEGPFGTSIELKWIPRYIVVDKDGKIALYNATTANDKNIVKTLDLLKK